jgi:hypothetical protein
MSKNDSTRGDVASEPIKKFLVEVEITPEQIGEFKVNIHKDYVRTWIEKII